MRQRILNENNRKMEQKKKTYVGSGKKVQDYDMVNISVCLSDIPKDQVNEFNGKKYVSLTVAKKREVDQYGKTHSVSINEYKPKSNPANHESEGQRLDLPEDDLPF